MKKNFFNFLLLIATCFNQNDQKKKTEILYRQYISEKKIWIESQKITFEVCKKINFDVIKN